MKVLGFCSTLVGILEHVCTGGSGAALHCSRCNAAFGTLTATLRRHKLCFEALLKPCWRGPQCGGCSLEIIASRQYPQLRRRFGRQCALAGGSADPIAEPQSWLELRGLDRPLARRICGAESSCSAPRSVVPGDGWLACGSRDRRFDSEPRVLPGMPVQHAEQQHWPKPGFSESRGGREHLRALGLRKQESKLYKPTRANTRQNLSTLGPSRPTVRCYCCMEDGRTSGLRQAQLKQIRSTSLLVNGLLHR